MPTSLAGCCQGPASLLASFLQGSRNQGLAGLKARPSAPQGGRGAEQWRGAPAFIPAVLLIQSKLTAPPPTTITTLSITDILFLLSASCLFLLVES